MSKKILKNPDVASSKALYKRFFTGVRNGFFMECGSADGIDHSICHFFEQTLDWRGINIEPNPYAFRHLDTNRPLAINENLALSDSAGELTLHIPLGSPRNSPRGKETLQPSLEFCRKDDWDENPNLNDVEEVTVRTDTYVNVIARHNVTVMDLFILDVEGHEVPVIRGMLDSPILPRVISIENNKTDMDEIHRMLDPLGYVVRGERKANSFFVKEASSS